jgi:hypothetical protein
MRKLNPARNAASNPLGALLDRILSHTRQTRYEEDAAAMAGSSHVSIEKNMYPSPSKCTISNRSAAQQ